MERSHQSGWLRLWQTRPGDFYLLLSAIILGIVVQHTIGVHGLIERGRWASHKFHQAALELGVMEKLQALEAAQPEVRVWVDSASGVYYCLRSANRKAHNGNLRPRGCPAEQYEPATHKSCK